MIQTATPESFENYTPRSEAGSASCLWCRLMGWSSLFSASGGEYGSAISLMDGHAVIELQQEERDELFIFLTMQPEVRSVRTDEENARLLAALWPRSRLETGAVLTLRDRIVPTGPADLTSSPREIYPILQTGFGKRFRPSTPGMPTFPTVCGTASAVPQWLGEMGRPVACAMTVAQARDGAVLGAVATLPDYRSRGYASACVTTLAAVLQGEGRRIDICPKTKGRAVFMNGSAFVLRQLGELRRYSSPSA